MIHSFHTHTFMDRHAIYYVTNSLEQVIGKVLFMQLAFYEGSFKQVLTNLLPFLRKLAFEGSLGNLLKVCDR